MMKSSSIVAIAGLFLVVGLGLSSCYKVEQGEVAVVKRWGKVIDQANEGLNWKVPVVDEAVKLSYKTQKVSYGGDGQAPLIAYSRDVQQADMTVSVNYRIDQAKATQIYSTVGENYMDVLVAPSIPQLAKNVLGTYAAADIVVNREAVAQKIQAELQSKLASRGIIIESFQIENIDFTKTYEAASEAAAEAQAQVLKARQELEKAKVEAQKQVAEAEARAKATIASAEAQARSTVLNSEAAATQRRLQADAEAYYIREQGAANAARLKQEGEARAAALAAQGNALGDKALAVDIFRALAWDGKLPTQMVPGTSVPFVNLTPKGQ